MNINIDLQKRSNNICELCGSTRANIEYSVPGTIGKDLEHHLLICSTCYAEIEHPETADPIHWKKFLNETIHSQLPAVRIVSWRMLHKLKQFDWAKKLLDANPLDEKTLSWANIKDENINSDISHISTEN